MHVIPQSEIDFVDLTADLIGVYVTNNNVPASELPVLITAVHSALVKLTAPPTPVIEKPVPLMPIKRTVTPDYLISLEDGRQYKSLKRHLTTHGLTPKEYREKWGLPHDYPMVAATYAAQRSELAKSTGLGQRQRRQPTIQKTVIEARAETAATSGRRGRPKKAATAKTE